MRFGTSVVLCACATVASSVASVVAVRTGSRFVRPVQYRRASIWVHRNEISRLSVVR
jgi:hypothetical protein